MSSDILDLSQTRERECIHRRGGSEGSFYTGEVYVQSLQRLRVSVAVEMVNKVGAFFWSDAARTRVWLCRDCARVLSLKEAA